jgi:hypothetical protein
MTTSVPDITFADTGITLPAESDILAGRLADIDSAFGGGVQITTLSTPQGQLAQSDAAIIGDKNAAIAEIVSMINPDYSSGRWQDAIGKLYMMDRISASGTVITVTCVGLPNTDIPAGTARVQDANGYIYACTTTTTIPASGTIDIPFQCLTTGPIACPAQTLTIYLSIFGWDTAANAAAGVVGTDVESRADFEYRRKQSVAANGVNSVQSIYAALLAVSDVVDAYVIDNPQPTAVTLGSSNRQVAANSLYACVYGGLASAIAAAIWNKKAPGCNYNGSNSYTIYDTNYEAPQPQYQVAWVTPTVTPIYFAIQISNNSSLPSNIVALIQAAIVSAFNGQDGGTRARIGAALFAGRYYAPVYAVNSNVNILSISLGYAVAAGLTSLTLGIDQIPTIAAANIAVTMV